MQFGDAATLVSVPANTYGRMKRRWRVDFRITNPRDFLISNLKMNRRLGLIPDAGFVFPDFSFGENRG
jgi:hypothetical protein